MSDHNPGRQYRPEDVSNPKHYRDAEGRECIDVMPEHFLEFLRSKEGAVTEKMNYAQIMMLGFCMGSAFKYRWRAGLKEGEPTETETVKAGWFDAFAKHILHPAIARDPRDR